MKKIRVAIIAIFLLILLAACKDIKEDVEVEHYNWNNGYCELDGGRLVYDTVGSKYHYKCEKCGKEYIFDGVMSHK